jgi:hyperosmotically inducible protein|tara:strand:+ start:1080 stop:1421 length:342 start_codon:yes stop_codon:yes gene_type:complete
MNRSPLNRGLGVALLAALLLSLVAAAGCQSYQEGSSRTVGEFTDDVGIQARVKLALLNDPEISGLRINTEVKRGVVSLYGRVGSRALQQRALDLAAGIKGVRGVEDRLTVVQE